ncbi:hypothetical protein Q4I30_003411 [Leishmania utingensis]|uniref:Uncharacterized protein n=1 Tax=Leishmania utingensis TaxID=653362 RepID=A0AAW3AKC3_9TRYP
MASSSASVAPASAPRARVLEVHRVASDMVALQEEAKSVRDRRLALEEIMRQERNRRLQAAASRRAEATTTSPSYGSGASSGKQQQEGDAVNPNAAPHTLKEYRRELDNVNGNKELYRLHYYTSAHLNPTDVHFYTAKSRVKEYQRHAPSPRKSVQAHHPLPTARRAHSEKESALPSTPAPASTSVMEGTSEQWTRSALLRMLANKRVLRRIEEHTQKEAAHFGRPVMRHTAAPVSPLNAAPRPCKASMPTRAVTGHPSCTTEAAVPRGDVSRSLAEYRSYAVSPSTQRWNQPHQRSPLQRSFSYSPLRLRGLAASPTRALYDAPFKIPFTYDSSVSLHAPRTDTSFLTSTRQGWPGVSAWKPLEHTYTVHPRDRGSGSAYEPIAEQSPSAPWEKRSTWTELTRRWSPPKQPATAPLLPPRDSSAREAGEVALKMPTAGPSTPKPTPTLLEGFRMPETVLKREDLFQGFS